MADETRVPLGFYHQTAEPTNAAKGSVWFNPTTRVISTFDGSNWFGYSGIQSVKLENKVLKFTKADGTILEVPVDYASTVELNAVIEIVNEHTQAINDIQDNYLEKEDETVKSVGSTSSHGVKLNLSEAGELTPVVTPGTVTEGSEAVVTGGSVAAAIEALRESLSENIGNVDFEIVAASESELATLGTNVKEAYKLVDKGGNQKGAWIKVYKDSALKSLTLSSTNAEGTAGQFLKYEYIDVDGNTQTTYVDVSLLLSEAEFKDGLQVNDKGEVSVKVDPASESFLTVGPDGVKVSGIQSELDKKANTSDVANLLTWKVFE